MNSPSAIARFAQAAQVIISQERLHLGNADSRFTICDLEQGRGGAVATHLCIALGQFLPPFWAFIKCENKEMVGGCREGGL